MKHLVKAFGTALILFFILNSPAVQAQPKKGFTRADTLRGTYGATRDWWDVLKYDLHVKFNIKDSTISGYSDILFKSLKKGDVMQIDLQEPMILDHVDFIYQISSTRSTAISINLADIKKEGNAYFIPVAKFNLQKGITSSISIKYHGKPRIARRPPWDGGLIWKKSADGSPWISVACQGLGASVWYPCKDHQADEPDSAQMNITVPDTLMCVGNGRYRGKTNHGDGTATYSWAVTNPINSYNIVPYIGKYVQFSEVFPGEKGKLDMDYWVLQENLAKAKEQFKDAPRMMKALEHWFGPYPFYADGYKLVESPHLGMEHQSAIAYGNKYKNGYMGTDLSGSGWGLKWDFIIIHESGHEWFANNITTKDIADMWVHESFTNYSETLFTDYWYGKEAGNAYVQGTRKNISNDATIIGSYNVNRQGSGDMYYKGGNMLHTIRQVINDDEKFRQILRGLNKTFYHQTVTTQQVEDYISKQSRIDFSKVFDQYLRTTQIPVLEYKVEGHKLSYRYSNCVNGFNMPLKVRFKTEQWIKPTGEWKTLDLYPEGDNSFTVDSNFYIITKKVE
jgi:aminopeptidase N